MDAAVKEQETSPWWNLRDKHHNGKTQVLKIWTLLNSTFSSELSLEVDSNIPPSERLSSLKEALVNLKTAVEKPKDSLRKTHFASLIFAEDAVETSPFRGRAQALNPDFLALTGLSPR